MCGIAGIIHFDGRPVDQSQLERMGAAIAHRGRDGVGIFVRGEMGLVHQRLAIVDLSTGGAQPRVSDDGQLAIVFNGEIVNHPELRDELRGQGVTFVSVSDTEVLLEIYRRYGLAGISKLRGFFAFAILDWQRHRIVLGRDIFGIKPLYVVQSGHTLSFASEIKSFFAGDTIKPKLDAAALQDYVVMQNYLPGRTLFSEVSAVPVASTVEYDMSTGAATTHKYWSPPEVQRDLVYEEWLEELDQRIQRSVSMWMRADVRVGAYVSGGLDSSLVATFAARQLSSTSGDRLATFSSLFSGSRTQDERLWSDDVSASIGSEHNRIEMDLGEIVDDHEDQMYVLDMPIAGYSAPYRTLSRKVRKHVKVVLTGHGGDENAAGYPKYIALALADQINAAYRTGSEIDIGPSLRFLGGFEDQARSIVAASLFRSDDALTSAIIDRSSFLWSDVEPEIRERCNGYRTVSAVTEMVAQHAGEPLRRALQIDRELLLPALLHIEDRTAMIENLESRPPLLDQEIVDWLAIAPGSFLLRNGLKSPLRDLGRRHLPASVVDNQRKSGVVFPVFDFVETHMRDLIESDLDVLDDAGLFRIPARQMLKNANELSNMRIIWALWSLGGWIRAFRPSL